MYLIVFVHEFGHVSMALLFKWNIKKINIYPFGGVTVFDESINKPFIEEFLVFIGGILYQVILYLFFSNLFDVNSYIYRIFNSYNITILIFNLLPIIPLDGSKVLTIFFNYIFPYKKTHLMTIYISYVLVILLTAVSIHDINMVAMSLLLTFLVIKEHKNHIYLFNVFLIDRYLNGNNYKKNKIINSSKISNMYKYFNNIFISNNNYVDEKNMLKKKFQQ